MIINEMELIEHYRKYFYTVKANTPELKRQAYHLRHEVYFSEYGYISEGCTEKEIEMDEFDNFSEHSLLFHRKTNKAIGYIRLIPYGDTHILELPIEHYCHDTLYTEIFSSQDFKKSSTGEISRMSIHPTFRRRTSDHNFQISENNTNFGNRRFPINYLPMCLTLAGLNLMFASHLDFSVALMERRLAVLLKKFGVQLNQIGHPIELYGQRAPFKILTKETYNHLKPEFQTLFHVIERELGLDRFPAAKNSN
ncbi:MAG: PEP-CTERM/exosortase system-associated acyltransferase [Gammaproteobacteria bacterium]